MPAGGMTIREPSAVTNSKVPSSLVPSIGGSSALTGTHTGGGGSGTTGGSGGWLAIAGVVSGGHGLPHTQQLVWRAAPCTPTM